MGTDTRCSGIRTVKVGVSVEDVATFSADGAGVFAVMVASATFSVVVAIGGGGVGTSFLSSPLGFAASSMDVDASDVTTAGAAVVAIGDGETADVGGGGGGDGGHAKPLTSGLFK